nr:MAG TPA: hypothetical protein [Caudoviricetes sp.]
MLNRRLRRLLKDLGKRLWDISCRLWQEPRSKNWGFKCRIGDERFKVELILTELGEE